LNLKQALHAHCRAFRASWPILVFRPCNSLLSISSFSFMCTRILAHPKRAQISTRAARGPILYADVRMVDSVYKIEDSALRPGKSPHSGFMLSLVLLPCLIRGGLLGHHSPPLNFSTLDRCRTTATLVRDSAFGVAKSKHVCARARATGS
jgi:hypothetical protein